MEPGKDVPTKEQYFQLTHRLCKVFFNPALTDLELVKACRPVMEQLLRLVSIDRARLDVLEADRGESRY